MNSDFPRSARALCALPILATLLAGAGCAPTPASLVSGPTAATPAQAPRYLERPTNGSIFQSGMSASTLYSSERRPSAVGETLKVDISESLQASQKTSKNTARDSKIAVKGPGGSSSSGIVEKILNADANAGSSDSYKGGGATETSASFTSSVTVTVINVYPNGYLLVAGERSVGLNGSVNTIRFSGVVDPRDIRIGNVVNSKDVADARLETVGSGDVSEASSRNWIQKLLARSAAIW